MTFKDLLDKIKKPFQQGLKPADLAKAVIIGLLFTIFPVFGVTTLLIASAALYFKLNLPIMVAISYIAAPLQILLFMPQLKVGEAVFGAEHTLLSIESIKAAFAESFFNAMGSLLFEVVCGVVGWLLISLPIALLLVFLVNKLEAATRKTPGNVSST